MKSIFKSNTKVKNYCVIGLGRFGSQIAKVLQSENQNVLVVDYDENVIASKGHEYKETILLDASNIYDLESIGIADYDEIIVAISNFEKSITICSNLKELGVKNIVAKATTTMHQRILKTMGINYSIIPETETANIVALKSIYGMNVEVIQFKSQIHNRNNLFIIQLPVKNNKLHDQKISAIQELKQVQASIIAVKKIHGQIVAPVRGDDIIQTGDVVFVLVTKDHIKSISDIFKNTH